MSESQTIHLAADLSFLHTDYMWRMPGSWVGYNYYSTSEFYEDIARIAQRGVMDMLFFGDTGGTPEDYGGNHEAPVRYGAKWPRHDMAPMIPLMAKAAPGVGFAITMSTTYHHPFYVARFFNALDHVTRGRIAWNAVTSAYKNEAANYGFDEMMEHDERYERAQEFLEVTRKLWDSVEKDALIADREKGIFADPAKVHRIDHRGRYFNVRGPLPALPSPQQRPVIIQAGLSGPGMDLAATYADMQFSTRRTVASMKQHREALDAKLASFGRKPRDVGILWSIGSSLRPGRPRQSSTSWRRCTLHPAPTAASSSAAAIRPWTTSASSSSSSFRSCSDAACPRPNTPARRCGKTSAINERSFQRERTTVFAHSLYLEGEGQREELAGRTNALVAPSQFFQQRRPGVLLGLNELSRGLRR